MKESLAIGLMSGSSLDGIDLALVRFTYGEGHYSYNIVKATTLPYPEEWQQRLANAFLAKPEDLVTLDKEYGAVKGPS